MDQSALAIVAPESACDETRRRVGWLRSEAAVVAFGDVVLDVFGGDACEMALATIIRPRRKNEPKRRDLELALLGWIGFYNDRRIH